MFQDLLVRLALAVFQGVEVFGVGLGAVGAGFEGGEVALDVAGGSAASRCGEADVGRHCGVWLEWL